MTVPVLLPRRWRLVDILSFFNLYYGLADLAVLWLGLAWWVAAVDREDGGIKVPTSDCQNSEAGNARLFPIFHVWSRLYARDPHFGGLGPGKKGCLGPGNRLVATL